LYANNTGKVLYLYVTPKLLELFNNILHTQPIQKDMKTRLVIYTHTHTKENKEEDVQIIEESHFCQLHQNCMPIY